MCECNVHSLINHILYQIYLKNSKNDNEFKERNETKLNLSEFIINTHKYYQKRKQKRKFRLITI